MTTIAWRAGVLAADTLVSYATYSNGHRDKIVRCGDYFVALAGAAWIKTAFEEWVTDGADPFDVPQIVFDHDSEFSVILMNDLGRAFEFGNGYLVPIDADYHAIGSGGFFALGAMAHGANAVSGVAAGIKHDTASGGDITRAVAPIDFGTVTGRTSHSIPN